MPRGKVGLGHRAVVGTGGHCCLEACQRTERRGVVIERLVLLQIGVYYG